jgi:hypothetical protein
VIDGQCGLQWLLQVRKRPTRWETIAYCATRQGLLIRIRDHLPALEKDEPRTLPLEVLVGCHAIEALPDYFPKQAPHRMAGD